MLCSRHLFNVPTINFTSPRPFIVNCRRPKDVRRLSGDELQARQVWSLFLDALAQSPSLRADFAAGVAADKSPAMEGLRVRVRVG